MTFRTRFVLSFVLAAIGLMTAAVGVALKVDLLAYGSALIALAAYALAPRDWTD